jgi:hypothetical protein
MKILSNIVFFILGLGFIALGLVLFFCQLAILEIFVVIYLMILIAFAFITNYYLLTTKNQ